MLDPKYGFIHSCPTNLGTGMRASVHVDLPGYTKEGLPALKARFETNSLSAPATVIDIFAKLECYKGI